MPDLLICGLTGVDVGEAPELIHILPLGRVHSQKGDFTVDRESYESMRRQMAEHGVDLVIDYEHQTLKGTRAPAAGWVKELVLQDGGIAARVQWTPAARKYLENREYRYLSPVITVRKADGKATGLHSAALTNTPAIDGMEPIVNSLNYEGGVNQMDLRKEIAKLLGLGEEAEPEQILEALRAALSEAKALREGGAAETVAANKAVLAALGLEDGAALEAVTGRIEALKAAPPADRGMEEKVLKLERQLADRDAEDAVALAFKAGKISAAQKPWAKSYALKDPAGFAQYVENAPMAVPLGTLTFAPGERALKADVLDDGTVLACKLTGVTLDDVKKYGLEG